MTPWENDRLAANGQPIRENFRQWFSTSRAVDRHGLPVMYFHGTALEGYTTSTDIERFDKSKVGDRFSADTSGFFFTNDQAYFNPYAESDRDHQDPGSGEGAVYPVYIRALRPLVVDDAFLQKEGMHPIGRNEDLISFWDNYQGLILEDWFDKRKHDAVILKDATRLVCGEPSQVVVAFEPAQIKSAIGNSGLFLKHSASLSDRQEAMRLERSVRAHQSLNRRQALELCP